MATVFYKYLQNVASAGNLAGDIVLIAKDRLAGARETMAALAAR